MTDILGQYDIEQVAAWYKRLAKSTENQGKKKLGGAQPLSSQFLNQYLSVDETTAIKKFSAPAYLSNYTKVTAALAYHRSVFLSKEKARIGKTKKIAGIIPRLKDGRWKGATELKMNYESLVEVGAGFADIIRIQTNGTAQEQDLFTSLRGFQLRSDVTVTGVKKNNKIEIEFQSWQVKAIDTYDFNFDEYLTVYNPDYQSASEHAIRPDLEKIRVYHSNAKRLEDAGLAAAFQLEVGPWSVTNNKLLARETIELP